MQYSVPAWVPEAARRRINELRVASWVDDKGRALLQRLATYPAMRTAVWERLPSEPEGVEGKIIDQAVHALIIFPRLRRPYPKTPAGWREWGKHLEKHAPLPEPAHTSQLALELREKIIQIKVDTDANWNRFWEGDKSITADQILAILEHLRLFYLRLDKEYRSFFAQFPEVRRWRGAKAAQKFLTEHLSNGMNETYGQPLDSIVAALVEVAFDLPQGLAAETVRGRRRGMSAPEKSKRKSR